MMPADLAGEVTNEAFVNEAWGKCRTKPTSLDGSLAWYTAYLTDPNDIRESYCEYLVATLLVRYSADGSDFVMEAARDAIGYSKQVLPAANYASLVTFFQ